MMRVEINWAVEVGGVERTTWENVEEITESGGFLSLKVVNPKYETNFVRINMNHIKFWEEFEGLVE